MATSDSTVSSRRAVVLVGAALIGGLMTGCSGSTSQPLDPAHMVEDGSWYVRQAWPHDGNPYETEHFVVYSDGASSDSRRRLADLAEEEWSEVIEVMGLDPATMFRFPADQDKIDLYANRYHTLEGGGARAYYAGVIMPSFDHEAGDESTSERTIRITLKHELVHVAEALLKGRYVGDVAVDDPRRMPVWFSEGTAEALSGGSTSGAPRTLDQVERLITEYGQINPISWKVDLPVSDAVLDAYPHYYYPMAHLAVNYLLDPDGMGRSPQDLAAVMVDMGTDVPFARAFEDHMGIGASEYEERFFSLMDTYLPQSEFPFESVGLGLAALAAGVLMVGSLIWSGRRSPAVPYGSTTAVAWSRPARIGFLTEVVVVTGAAVLLITRALFSIGLDRLPPGANRAGAYTLTAGYFVVTTGLLMWAMRRRGKRSRIAFLIPLLVVVATVIAVVLIDLVL